MTDDESTVGRRPLPVPPKRRRCIRVVDSPDRSAIGRELELEGGSIVLGRSSGDGLPIKDPRVSREHARLTPGVGRWFIADLNTQNGTFLSGYPVKASDALSNNDVISVGDTLLVVDAEPDPEDMRAHPNADPDAAQEIIGVSYAASMLRRAIASVAPAPGPVLILGETGTGKEVTATAIHRLSGRKGPLVSVNCAAIPSELAESQLFGHRKGAFTSAVADHEGFFVRAHQGTLLLDEIGDLPPPLQAKLLRVLEDREVLPVGDSRPLSVDVRVLSATHQDLGAGTFRPDLYARISEHVLTIPRLARRRADILVLWDHFQQLEAFGTTRRDRTPELSEALLLYDWPLNVRELARLARRTATYAAEADTLDLLHVPAVIQKPLRDRAGTEIDDPDWDEETGDGEPEEKEGVDRVAIEDALRSARGNVSRAAEALGENRQHFYRLMHRLRIDPRAYRRTSR